MNILSTNVKNNFICCFVCSCSFVKYALIDTISVNCRFLY